MTIKTSVAVKTFVQVPALQISLRREHAHANSQTPCVFRSSVAPPRCKSRCITLHCSSRCWVIDTHIHTMQTAKRALHPKPHPVHSSSSVNVLMGGRISCFHSRGGEVGGAQESKPVAAAALKPASSVGSGPERPRPIPSSVPVSSQGARYNYRIVGESILQAMQADGQADG